MYVDINSRNDYRDLIWTLKSDKVTAASQMEDYSMPQRKKGGWVSGVGGMGGFGFSDKLQLFCILSLILLLGPSAPLMTTASTEPIPGERGSVSKTVNMKRDLVNFETIDEPDAPEILSQSIEPKSTSQEEDDELLPSNSRQIRSEGGSKNNDIFNSAPIQYSRLSHALERMHFGPLLRQFRPISNRAVSSSQNHGGIGGGGGDGGGGDSLMTNYTPRTRVTFPHSGESGHGPWPATRFSRPIMRLRWGRK